MPDIINAENISFSYYNNSRLVLDKCSLSIKDGEIVSILGSNGAGKSTLLNCLCGLLQPVSGEIYLNQKSIKKMDRRSIAQVIGYVQQTQQTTFSHTVENYVLMGKACNIGLFQHPTQKDKDDVENILEGMGISYLSKASVLEISGGERQQVAIARAIAQHPQVVFFDEPTAHLDYGNQIRTLKLISDLRSRGYAVIMTTHNPDHCMMLGGNVAILDKTGKIEFGKVEDIITENKLKKVYETDLRISFVQSVNRVTCIPMGI